MVEVFYGMLVAAAAYKATQCRCELVQKVMATLFVGWVIYINAANSNSFTSRVELNLYLDLAQLGLVSVLYLSWWKCVARKVCLWVGAIFCMMIALHTVQLTLGIGLRVYYYACNMLFTAQLICVVVYSQVAFRDWRGRQAWRTTISTKGRQCSKVVPMQRKKA